MGVPKQEVFGRLCVVDRISNMQSLLLRCVILKARSTSVRILHQLRYIFAAKLVLSTKTKYPAM